ASKEPGGRRFPGDRPDTAIRDPGARSDLGRVPLLLRIRGWRSVRADKADGPADQSRADLCDVRFRPGRRPRPDLPQAGISYPPGGFGRASVFQLAAGGVAPLPGFQWPVFFSASATSLGM